MSDTPRTDSHQEAFNDNGPRFGLDDVINAYELARQLERELNEAQSGLISTHLAVDDGLLAVMRQRDEWKKCAEEFAYILNELHTRFVGQDEVLKALSRFNKLKDQTK